MRPFFEAANEKLAPVEQQMKELEAEITSMMEAGIQADGTIEFTRIDIATAVAEVITRKERELDAKTFFDSVPPLSVPTLSTPALRLS